MQLFGYNQISEEALNTLTHILRQSLDIAHSKNLEIEFSMQQILKLSIKKLLIHIILVLNVY